MSNVAEVSPEYEVQTATAECEVDLGIELRWGKQTVFLFVTSNRYIVVKNTFGWNAVAFCACHITQLFSVFDVQVTVRRDKFL